MGYAPSTALMIQAYHEKGFSLDTSPTAKQLLTLIPGYVMVRMQLEIWITQLLRMPLGKWAGKRDRASCCSQNRGLIDFLFIPVRKKYFYRRLLFSRRRLVLYLSLLIGYVYPVLCCPINYMLPRFVITLLFESNPRFAVVICLREGQTLDSVSSFRCLTSNK